MARRKISAQEKAIKQIGKRTKPFPALKKIDPEKSGFTPAYYESKGLGRGSSMGYYRSKKMKYPFVKGKDINICKGNTIEANQDKDCGGGWCKNKKRGVYEDRPENKKTDWKQAHDGKFCVPPNDPRARVAKSNRLYKQYTSSVDANVLGKKTIKTCKVKKGKKVC
tara:strand:- start:69 stop:566 length:498 start_codon:yes stop_codon:yes gene_type:complete